MKTVAVAVVFLLRVLQGVLFRAEDIRLAAAYMHDGDGLPVCAGSPGGIPAPAGDTGRTRVPLLRKHLAGAGRVA